ncbi:ferric reductase like transmembrane component-domain-containing protein [Aspergillus pseudoustus]|uniref:ferric-chelate reductase (NADPH) n=1 Tax=Aspergillus pseudoustus TaxID=1810923 RepID=A0ABR4JC24_9EURO
MSLPWLDEPVMLHSDRDPGMCMMTAEQCAYKSQYWVFWYEADHRYALPTVAFFLVAVALFTIGHWLAVYTPNRVRQTSGWSRIAAFFRFLSYRSWRIWQWNTQSLGGLLLVGAGAVFFLAMTLGPHPYYWPNTREISFGNSPPIATRTGFLALACMPFLFALGAKSNPITYLTSISSEKLNIWHNWVAWAMYALALVHTFPFIVFHIWKGDIVTEFKTGGVWVTGVVALLAQTWLTFLSIPWIRNRYYEFFKAGHYVAAWVFVIFFFIHCDFRMSSWDYFIATGVLYALCWGYSACRTYFEHGVRHRAVLLRETEHTLKISIETDMEWRAGQHIYIRFLTGSGLQALSTHPFTICSVSEEGVRNTLVFYVRPRGGLTGRLLKMAEKQPGVQVPVLLDGPYGGLPSQRCMSAFERSVVVGGGAGAGFTLSMIEEFIQGLSATQSVGGRGMNVIIASQDPELRTWYLEALKEVEAKYARFAEKARIHVAIHQTGPAAPTTTTLAAGEASKEANASSVNDPITSEMFSITFATGRPNLPTEIEKVVGEAGVSSVGIVVCGPSSMSHDVATAAATAQRQIIGGRTRVKDVFLHQESFS